MSEINIGGVAVTGLSLSCITPKEGQPMFEEMTGAAMLLGPCRANIDQNVSELLPQFETQIKIIIRLQYIIKGWVPVI